MSIKNRKLLKYQKHKQLFQILEFQYPESRHLFRDTNAKTVLIVLNNKKIVFSVIKKELAFKTLNC